MIMYRGFVLIIGFMTFVVYAQASCYDELLTSTDVVTEIPRVKQVGKKVRVPFGKKLMSYYHLGRSPVVDQFVAVLVKRIDANGKKKNKMVWGIILSKNRYVYSVQISESSGNYFTDANMYEIVDKNT